MDIMDKAPSQPGAQPPEAHQPVPWSLRQTIVGILLTLVPWLILSLGSVALTGQTTATGRPPVSRQLDIIMGIAVFVISALLEAIFLVAPLIVVLRLRIPGARWRERLGWLGLRRTAPGSALMVIVVGLGAALVGSVLYSWVVTTLHLPLQTNTDALLTQGRSQPFTTLGLLAAAALVAPICEEIFFRGFAFAGLLKGMSLLPAVLLSSAVFAVAHADLGSLVPLFIIGLVLAWARWRTDSLWPGVIIHMANNTLAAVTIIPLLFK
jgi:membrane protease YdiL (CAAX protease family)